METTAQRVNGTPQRGGHLPMAPVTLTAPANLTATSSKPTARPSTSEQPAEPSSSTAKTALPLIVINSLAVYGQLAYAYENISPGGWPFGARLSLAIGFAAAVESVALYVGWHAHDALLLKAYGTARSLRRASYLIAAVVATINYAHFANGGLDHPTQGAVAFGLLSILSPWLWGLHSRRAHRVQLLKTRAIDDAGAEFSTTRRRNFPIRSIKARRWSIDHNITDPVEAWDGYRQHVASRQAATRQASPSGTANDGRPVPVTAPSTTIVVTPSNRRGRTRQTWPAKLRRRTVKPAPVASVNRPTLTGPAEPSNGTAEPVKPAPSAPSLSARQPVKRHRQTGPGGTVRKTAKQQLRGAAAVLAAHAENPSATNAQIAKISGASIRTVERHRPAKTTATEGA